MAPPCIQENNGAMALKTRAFAMGVAVSAGALVLVQATTQPPNPAPLLSVHEVVARMVAMNAARTRALHAFSAWRSYHVQYDGIGDASAAMTVRVEFHQPGPKIFTIVSESGSAMLRHHVLEPLVKAEIRDAVITSNQGSAIVPANYEFHLLATPADNPGGGYVLEATPHADRNRFLFRGTIWLSANDFGIKRIKGKLPRSPSFWVKSATFDYHSQKVGDFWLPASNQTLAHLRFFGHATLDICFHDFVLTSISPVGPYASSGESP